MHPIIPNTKQQICIDTIEGPVMVLAGPGTGKTFTVIQRIKNMLNKGIKPSSVLCLTYSEAAASEMKSRLVKETGTNASGVYISTYHAFCSELIREYPFEFEFVRDVKIIDDISKRIYMEKALDEVKPEFYRTKWGDYLYFIPELLKAVDAIKSTNTTEEEYFKNLNTLPAWKGRTDELEAEYKERKEKGKLVKTFLNTYESHKKKIGKAIETAAIYKAYDRLMKQNNFIDFNDMINMVIEVFESNNDFLKRAASEFKYFLVDEYQDTNRSQNKLVSLLAKGAESRNIFVVGDDDQVIYEFQGARPDTLEKFLIEYPDTKVICLNENNRSTQNILDLSYKIISSDKTRLEFNDKFKTHNISKVLTAKNPDIVPLNKKIQIHGFADIKQENNYIIDKISEITNSDTFPKNKSGEKDLSKIAILTRENIELEKFAELLESRNIKYQIKETKNIFDVKSSLLTYFYLKTLHNRELHADKLFGLLLNEPFKFEYGDFNYLLKQNRLNHKDFITNIICAPGDHKWENKEKTENFIKTYLELEKLKNSLNIHELILTVINKTGILKAFIDNDINKSDNILALKKTADESALYMQLNKPSYLGGFLKHLDTAFESEIPINIDKEDYILNAIQLVTLHGSKGREFDYVFMPGMISKKWENKRVNNSINLPLTTSMNSEDDVAAKESERTRLLFVGITRAKHSLYITYSNFGDGKTQEVTKYLEPVMNDTDIVETYNHELTKDEMLNEIITSVTQKTYDYASYFKDEISARIEDFSMSPSALNAYLNCPENFLYSQILSIPVLDSNFDNAKYGSAIHKTLHTAVNSAKRTGIYYDSEKLIEEFVKNIDEEEFSNEDKRNRYKKKGKKCIEEYRKYLVQTPPDIIYATEYKFDYVPFGNRFLKGFIDRIEQTSETTFELFDYKTGSAKPKTQIADGKDYENYLNQLRFYKYAFELQNPGTEVTRAGLIFVEEPDKSYYTTLSKEDNENIIQKIKFVYEGIKNSDFDPVDKDKGNCEYCPYIHLCKLNKLR